MAGLFFMAILIAWIMHTWKKVTVSILKKVTLFANYAGEGHIVHRLFPLFGERGGGRKRGNVLMVIG